MVPPSRTERMHRQDYPSLQAVNGTSIPTFGNRSLTLDLGPRIGHSGGSSSLQTSRSPSLELIFSAYNLLVDMRHKHLSDTLTQLKVQGITAHTSSPSPFLLPPRPKTGFEAILCEFPAVIQPCNNNHSIKHEVDTPYHHYRSTSPFACQAVVPRAAQNCTAGI